MNEPFADRGFAAWTANTALSTAAPPDYVAGALLATASALLGNSTWVEAWPGWREPPFLWVACVGDSGTGKSPGAGALLREVLPQIEARMKGDWPDRHREWEAERDRNVAALDRWRAQMRKLSTDAPTPERPPAFTTPEPLCPRFVQNDATIEKVAALLSQLPKGLLIVRDELAGWLASMTQYNESGRQFWLEAWNAAPYRVERQKHPDPVDIPRLGVSVFGTMQPERLARVMHADPDDGLLARFMWVWPEPTPFARGGHPDVEWAVEVLDRLRLLDMVHDPADPRAVPQPRVVRLAAAAADVMLAFGQEMQAAQERAHGLMRSSYGKARGMALRLACVLEHLKWAAEPVDPLDAATLLPPESISCQTMQDACRWMRDYALPMAERTFGDAALPLAERNITTLARWIIATRPAEVHVPTVQRTVRLPGLRDAKALTAACTALAEAGWLRRAPGPVGFQQRPRNAWAVNPRLWESVS